MGRVLGHQGMGRRDTGGVMGVENTEGGMGGEDTGVGWEGNGREQRERKGRYYI